MKIVPLVLSLLASCAVIPGDRVLDSTRGVEEALVELSHDLPLSQPVVVQDASILWKGYLGLAFNHPGHYRVLLEQSLTDREKTMVLRHEYAHLLVWDRGLQDDNPHGTLWGATFAEVFRRSLD